MENNVNNMKGMKILVAVLICIILGLGGFIVYDKLIKDDNVDTNKTKPESKEKTKETKLSDEEADKNASFYEGANSYFEVHKTMYAWCYDFPKMLYSNDKFLVSDMSDEEKLNYLYNFVIARLDSSKYGGKSVDAELTDDYIYFYPQYVKGLWRDLYGSDVPFPTTIPEDMLLDGWDAEGGFKRSTAASDGCGPGAFLVTNTLVNAVEKDDKLILYEQVVSNKEGKQYYGYAEKERLVSKNEKDNATITANYRFTYKKDSKGNYYFYSVEKIK